MSDKISIVVPVYNVEKYIQKCLDSLLKQSYENYEIIIINDGSEDSCKNIITSKYSADSRIKYFEQENAGLSAARNTGISMSTGQYIAFIDSDDWVDENFLKILYENIKKQTLISQCVICSISMMMVRFGKEHLLLKNLKLSQRIML